MFKFAIAVAALVAVALAAPLDVAIDETTPVDETLLIDETTPVDETLLIDETTPIPILWESVQVPNSEGAYSWSYETGNGIKAQEKGTPKEIGTGDEAKQAMVADGQFSYIDNDGNLIEVTYVADENGFRAMGAHLPTPPPMPPAISRALEWIAAQPKTTPLPPTEEENE